VEATRHTKRWSYVTDSTACSTRKRRPRAARDWDGSPFLRAVASAPTTPSSTPCAEEDGTTLNVLLVDSEEALAPEPPPAETESQEEKRQRERSNARVRRDHLASRDGWDLSDVEPEQIHLMVPCMEAWIAADPDGMALYYGQGFRLKSLPRRLNLEDEPKANLCSKLANATKDTSKGEYSESNNAKIRHASKLLEKISATKVAARCPRFAAFTAWLDQRIEEA